jgi:hypothetical protein
MRATALFLHYEEKNATQTHGNGYEDGCLLVLAPRNLAEICRRFRDGCCVHHQGDKQDVRPDDATTQATAVFK